uniref:Uncharacterized protein n=1 Tax=Trypanosoma vivax (strain Y486) TaxID=1055687 RepID=G0U328_TRYVY|nr:hypothetical protein TVY486_0905040 [Trypanosoma vivax Y486]
MSAPSMMRLCDFLIIGLFVTTFAIDVLTSPYIDLPIASSPPLRHLSRNHFLLLCTWAGVGWAGGWWWWWEMIDVVVLQFVYFYGKLWRWSERKLGVDEDTTAKKCVIMLRFINVRAGYSVCETTEQWTKKCGIKVLYRDYLAKEELLPLPLLPHSPLHSPCRDKRGPPC